MNSGTSTSIGGGGAVAASSLPTSQTDEDRHQHQADAVDGGGNGAVALAGLASHRRARSVGAGTGRPTTAATVTTAQTPSGVRSRSPEPSALKPSRPHTAIAADRVSTAVLNCGPSWRHTSGDSGRDIAMQQRVEHDLAAQLGQALSQLVGAGDDHLALLDLALADRRQVGQPGAIGLHHVGFRHRVGARLDLERRQKVLGVGQVVAGDRGGGRRRGADVGDLLAQARRSRPAAAWPVRPAWRCGRAGASRRRSAGRTAVAAAMRAGRTPCRRRRAAATGAKPGGGNGAFRSLLS